jgi:peptide/nickel transport system ATP-binding protein
MASPDMASPDMARTPQPVLRLDGVRVSLRRGPTVIDGITLDLRPGEIVCLVGESGSGKTTTALSAFGYCAPGLSISAGDVAVDGEVIRGAAQFAAIRGSEVSYVPQNPSTALNPSMRVADAIADTMRGHSREGAGRHAAAREMLGRVGLPDTEEFGRRFPHQLSGGQQQRVCIAAALASNPKVVVLDEPTTGLDVVTQARILNELLRLREEEHVAMLYVTHDLAVAAHIADRIVVMYGGHIVEEGPADEVLRRPRHPYTRGLMAATPDHVVARVLEVMPGAPVDIADRPPGCPFAPRCPQKVDACDAALPVLELHGTNHYVRCPEWTRTASVDWAAQAAAAEREAADLTRPVILKVTDLCAEHRTRSGNVVAANGISFSIRSGECLALVGESGSGKTTIARVMAGLHPTWTGQVLLEGEPLAARARGRTRDQRRRVQMVFQSPTDALNPRHSVGEILSRPARVLRGLGRSAAAAEVESLLDAVRLPARYARQYPRELSGGQRQRVAIARALAADPDVIICDEITSALDVSVQARILELLRDLRQERGLSLLFITHDLGIVATIADEVLVLDQGVICESGKTKTLLASPVNDYTKQLLHSAPSLIDSIGAWDASEA